MREATAAPGRTIPSLDGLRACSVLFVIAAHSIEFIRGNPNVFPFLQIGMLALLGVDTFFVISGFLITSLLLRELESRGTINLRRFYFRRFARIFPPFYVYLGAVALLAAIGVAHIDRWAIPSAGLYVWNYWMRPNSWLVGHTWSLSLEEQFYLLWPPVVALCGKRKSTYVALSVIALAPLSRMVTYFAYAPWRFHEGIMLHTRIDTIMFGCVLALLWDNERFQSAARRFAGAGVFGCSVLYLTVISPLLDPALKPRFVWIVGYPLHGFLIALVLFYVVQKPSSQPGKFLNLAPLRHVGVISYSLYLWQEMFAGPDGMVFPLNLLPTFACAELSYWLVERTALRLRDAIDVRFRGRVADASQTSYQVESCPKPARVA